MLVDLGPDFRDHIVNTDHVVRINVARFGDGDRYIDRIEIELTYGECPRWMYINEEKSRGSEVLEDLKRRLHVQPADWSTSRSSVETLEPI